MSMIDSYLPTKYWLMKTEPSEFSFADLLRKNEEVWDGVRNYQARNFMRDHMKVGHKVFFYHSNASPSGIAGICEVVKEAIPDKSQFSEKSPYFDSKSDPKNPRWMAVTVGKPLPIKTFLSLENLKKIPELQKMLLLQKGQRLSVLPLTKKEWDALFSLAFQE